MLSVDQGWTAEERSSVRKITHNLLVSWKKQANLSTRTFTIGFSTIGGSDIIGINPGAIGSPGIYQYFDESDYVLGLSWERKFSVPLGGISVALAEAELDNTSGRFLPDYLGGDSVIFTSILPRRPLIINSGFNFGGVDKTLPAFAGLLTRSPEVDLRQRRVQLNGADYLNFFQNKYIDREIMFTGQRTDQVIESIFRNVGMSTAQYELDSGLNTIPFGIFEQGSNMYNILNKLTESENARLYQDEQGIFRFENRLHWQNTPHDSVSYVIHTPDVINAVAPDEDHIINVVEIKSQVRKKQAEQLIYQSQSTIELPTNPSTEYFISYDDPILEVTSIDITANSAEDGSGTDRSANVTISRQDDFSKSTKFTFTNTHSSTIYITNLIVYGRPAKVVSDLYYRDQDDSSVTAFEERPLTIENEYIQDDQWPRSLARMLLNDYSTPENLLEITILAKPSMQTGDLVSWQGNHWRVYGIRTRLDPSMGFLQELSILKANPLVFFSIGISTIGSGDVIAP